MSSMFKKLEETFLVSLLLMALVVLIVQVASRYLMTYPIAWTEELARFLFLWIVFMGAAYLFRKNEHIAILLIVQMLPRKVQTFIYVTMQTVVLVFLCTLVWYGFDVAWKVRNLPTIAMEISSAWEYAAVPVASILMATRTAKNLYSGVKNGAPESDIAALM